MPCYSRLLSWVVLSSSISACIETGPPEEVAEQKAQALIPAGAVSEFAPRTPALTFDIPKSERLNPGNNLTLLVQNQRDVAADVTFHVTVGEREVASLAMTIGRDVPPDLPIAPVLHIRRAE